MKQYNPFTALFTPVLKLSLFLISGWVLIYIILMGTKTQTSPKVVNATHLLLTGDETGASADFQQYLTQHSDDVNAYIQICDIYLANNHPHSAAKFAEMALHEISTMSNEQRSQLYILLSEAYHKEGVGMQGPALAAAHEAVGFETDSPEALNCLGYLMVSTDRTAGGISIGLAYIEKAITSSHNDINLSNDPTEIAMLSDSYGWGLYNLSLCIAQPESQHALNHAQTVLRMAADEIPPDATPEEIKTINYHLAVICYKTGHKNEALTALNTALLYDPASRELMSLKTEINQMSKPVYPLTVTKKKFDPSFTSLHNIILKTGSPTQVH